MKTLRLGGSLGRFLSASVFLLLLFFLVSCSSCKKDPIVTPTPPTQTEPTVTVDASAASVPEGGKVTVTWSATNATSVTVSGVAQTGLSGTFVAGPLGNDTTITVVAIGKGGTASKSVTVTVIGVKITLTSDQATINYGDSVTLSWTSANATAVTVSGKSVGTSGSMKTSYLVKDSTFTAIATGVSITKTATVTVKVNPPGDTTRMLTQKVWYEKWIQGRLTGQTNFSGYAPNGCRVGQGWIFYPNHQFGLYQFPCPDCSAAPGLIGAGPWGLPPGQLLYGAVTETIISISDTKLVLYTKNASGEFYTTYGN